MTPLLEIKNLSKIYPTFKLDNISFTLESGRIMGFLGENGAGKSTTIKLILNIIKRDNGLVKIFGKDILTDELSIKERLGVIFDECCFHNQLTPRQLITIFSHIYKNWDTELYYKYITKFNLSPDLKIGKFSRGMKVKLGLAVALAHKPDILILDEATSGLDPVMRDEILEFFMNFVKKPNHAVLMSSHITEDIDRSSDDITVIHKGKLVLTGNYDNIRNDMGIILGSDLETANKIGSEFVERIRIRKTDCDILIKNKSKFNQTFPEYTTTPITARDIASFYSIGEILC